GGQRALVGDLRLREVLRLAGDVDGEGEVLAGQLAAPLAVVGGDDVSRIGARLASGGEIGGVAVVPRRELVEERRAVVVAGAGGIGAGLEALTLVAPGGPRTAPLDGAGGGDDAGAVLRQAGDLADETLAGAL